MPYMTFWDMQVYTINHLTKLGFKYALYDRIPIFKVWLKLNRLEYVKGISLDIISGAREGLVGLLQYKHAGLEPPCKGKRYIKDTNVQ